MSLIKSSVPVWQTAHFHLNLLIKSEMALNLSSAGFFARPNLFVRKKRGDLSLCVWAKHKKYQGTTLLVTPSKNNWEKKRHPFCDLKHTQWQILWFMFLICYKEVKYIKLSFSIHKNAKVLSHHFQNNTHNGSGTVQFSTFVTKKTLPLFVFTFLFLIGNC